MALHDGIHEDMCVVDGQQNEKKENRRSGFDLIGEDRCGSVLSPSVVSASPTCVGVATRARLSRQVVGGS